MSQHARANHDKWVHASAIVAASAVIGIAGVSIATQVQTVTITDAGVTRQVHATTGKVAHVLERAGIEVSEHDRVSPCLECAPGGQVTITRATAVTVENAGKTERTWAFGRTLDAQLDSLIQPGPAGNGAAVAGTYPYLYVARAHYQPLAEGAQTLRVAVDGQVREISARASSDLGGTLAQAGIKLNPLDTLAITKDGSGMIARIQRVTKEYRTETSEIPYTTTEEDDPDALVGTKRVETEGEVGELTRTTYVETVDGKVTVERVVSEKVTAEPVTEVIKKGTMTRAEAEADPERAAAAGIVPAPANPTGAQAIAQGMLGEFGFGPDQFGCLVNLWNRESGWSTTAANPSGAYGIPQALPGSKMASAGADWRTNPATQIRWGLGYIAGRYGTPCGAWSAFQAKGWY